MTIKKSLKISARELRLHEPEQLITFRVSVLSQLLARVVENGVSKDLGLSSRQWRLLVMLNRLGPATSGQVAAATRLDQSQVSRASYELADKQLIDMTHDPADRRKQLLAVTPAGVEVLQRGIGGSRHRQAQLKACMSDEEYAAFGDVLDRLTRRAHELLAQSRGVDA